MVKTTVPMSLALGLPDDRTARTVIGPDGKPSLVFANQLQLPPQTSAALTDTCTVSWFPKPADDAHGTTGPVVNFCADYDTYSRAIQSMCRHYAAGFAIFNHPRVIADLALGGLSARLGGIENLHVPKRLRFQANRPEDFTSAFGKAGFVYPVSVQLASSRDNTSIIVIRSDADWAKALATQWPMRWFNMVQLAGSDLRQHLRYRVCFVGKQAELTAFAYALPPHQVARAVKIPLLVGEQRLKSVCQSLNRLVKLDCWTVELAAVAKDRLQLEHLWVGLPPAGVADPAAALWPKVAPRLHALVTDPQAWRFSHDTSTSAVN